MVRAGTETRHLDARTCLASAFQGRAWSPKSTLLRPKEGLTALPRRPSAPRRFNSLPLPAARTPEAASRGGRALSGRVVVAFFRNSGAREAEKARAAAAGMEESCRRRRRRRRFGRVSCGSRRQRPPLLTAAVGTPPCGFRPLWPSFFWSYHAARRRLRRGSEERGVGFPRGGGRSGRGVCSSSSGGGGGGRALGSRRRPCCCRPRCCWCYFVCRSGCCRLDTRPRRCSWCRCPLDLCGP
jgi:hypothetical protein